MHVIRVMAGAKDALCSDKFQALMRSMVCVMF